MRKTTPENVHERFWQKVAKSPGCWVWIASKNSRGYGAFRVAGKSLKAHRVSWELANGMKVPDGLDVCHRCDNPSCVNPSHLYAGTESDNMQDRVARGRDYNASKTHCKHGHKMTPENTFFRNGSGRRCIACTKSYRAPSRLARMVSNVAAVATLLLVSVGHAAVVTSISTEVFLYRGTSKLTPAYVDMSACVAAANAAANASTATSGTVTYTCKGAQTRVIATYSANPPPPPACPPQPASETQTVQCPAGTTGTWTQTRSYVSVAAPTCWSAGNWTPATAPAGACTANPPPPPPVGGAFPAQLLNFAETWDRNWNFGGHTVDSRFNENYGYWDYTETTYEPWLFDRASVGYYLYEATGNDRWRTKFLSDFLWYRTRIDAQGIFTPKGNDDTKYGYVTPFVLYERLTGDAQYRPVAKRIYDSWVREFGLTYSPSIALWTEREIGLALEAAVAWYDLTGEAAALTRANALVAQWTAVSGSAGAPLVSYTQHEGGGPGGTTPTELVNSPWMSALYFQAARRLHEETGNTEVLAQASRYFDWCDANCFYDGALQHPEFAGLVFPRYLTPSLIGDGGYDEGNMAHAIDVAGLIKFAIYAKTQRGESTAAAQARLTQMLATADRDFANWTRTATYLPRYRVTPPRKVNWQVRGAREVVR